MGSGLHRPDERFGQGGIANPDEERNESPIDAATIAELRKFDRGGEPGLLETLTRVFQDQTASQLDDLERMLREGDAAGVVRTAHALKGSCASIGARRMARLAAELHGLGRAESFASAAGVLARLREEFVLAGRALERETGGPPQ